DDPGFPDCGSLVASQISRKKTNFLIEVFPFRGLLIVGVRLLQRASIAVCSVGRSTAHPCRTPWKCWREPPSGRSPKEKWQITKILREDFLCRGPLSIWGGVHVDIPRRPGEAVSYAVSGGAFGSCFDGCRRVKDSRSGPKTRIKNDGSPGTLRCRSRFAFYIFCFRDPRRSRAGRILMRFKGLFSRGKVTGA